LDGENSLMFYSRQQADEPTVAHYGNKGLFQRVAVGYGGLVKMEDIFKAKGPGGV
jgi:hypothetical protein